MCTKIFAGLSVINHFLTFCVLWKVVFEIVRLSKTKSEGSSKKNTGLKRVGSQKPFRFI